MALVAIWREGWFFPLGFSDSKSHSLPSAEVFRSLVACVSISKLKRAARGCWQSFETASVADML
jgi:hypothetical protein